jgi:hypothetical protein
LIVADAGTPLRIGATLTSLTVTVIDVPTSATLSVTITVKVYVLPPWLSDGTQVNTPVEGSIVAPWGALLSEKVSVCGGTSGSVAPAVKLSKALSSSEAAGGTPDSVGEVFPISRTRAKSRLLVLPLSE